MIKFVAYIVLVIQNLSSISSEDRIASEYPQDYFAPPLEIPLYLSGTFGELRTSHFHSGLDLKTNQKEGIKVLSVADGYVSRIKISPFGFGKAIYIRHPNGYTSVYAHLKEFNPKIQEFITNRQYEKRSYSIEIHPEASQFPVTKGELIAYSGNSGGSGGPHLHFEIRDAASQKPINPLLFNLPVGDKIPPAIQGVAVYNLGKSRHTSKAKILPVKKIGTTYRLVRTDTLRIDQDIIGFGINTYDKQNGSSNRNGIYFIRMNVDEQIKYHFEMERFSFNETKYIGCHMDYEIKKSLNTKYHRCYLLPGNKFSAYRLINNRGLVKLENGKTHKVEIISSDAYGNQSSIVFYVKYDPEADFFNPQSPVFSEIFPFNQVNTYNSGDLDIRIPKGVLFDTIYFNHDIEFSKEAHILSAIHKVHFETEPLFNYYSIGIKPKDVLRKHRSKFQIVKKSEETSVEGMGGAFDGTLVKSRVRTFGDFFITVDTLAPAITPINISEGKTISTNGKILVKISDEISGIKSYTGYIDNKWILMEYDAKNDLLIHYFDERTKVGEHIFTLNVSDKVNNQSNYSAKFILSK